MQEQEQEEYDKKFAEMQKYIPFLEAMIERLQNVKDKDNREIQLKMQSLHDILTNRKKLKIETLQRCENVLQKLYSKVEKGNTPTNMSRRDFLPSRNDDNTAHCSTSSENAEPDQSKKARESQDAETSRNAEESQNTEDDVNIIEETPRSPDAAGSSSPDCQIVPIEIPTERKSENKRRQQQAKQKMIQVITITDRPNNMNTSIDYSDDVAFCEWDMLEESETHNTRSRGDRLATDVSNAARLISSNLPQKTGDSRGYALDMHNIPTVPVPSLGGSRRLTSVLEKNRLNLNLMTGNIARSESPVNVPEVRLNSPDPEILFASSSSSAMQSKSKDSHSAMPKPPSIPLLLSPPPVSNVPPLSMEDLAELLNDEGDADRNKTGDKTGRHTMHLPTRKPASNAAKPNDHRVQTPFLGPKPPEPRYANNYERHPRQRDAHGHEITRDKQVAGPHGSEEAPTQIHSNFSNKPDAPLYQRRSDLASETREGRPPPIRQDSEFVIDGVDYYNMHINPMHWSPSAVSSNDHHFPNTQWTSPVYAGMPNSSLQTPIQHPYQSHLMESQFRPQFPNIPADPRPLITPAAHPPRSQDHMTSSGFPVTPQYRGFQMNQGSYDPAFTVDRSVDYPHVRPWEAPASRINETTPYENVIPCGVQVQDNSAGASYTRPSTPCPWGRNSNRPNRGRGGYYNNDRNRTETRPSFNRDGRRPDRLRDGPSDRETSNRFPNRDPRVRPEHTAVSPNQTKDTSVSVRDPRLAKDKRMNSPSKTKDSPHNERDPRKRSTPATVTSATATATTATKEKSKEKSKSSQKVLQKERMDKINLPKDRMQSPLESIYGVIDTKTTQSVGLQKFKIPKIKRCEPLRLNQHPTNETNKPENIPPFAKPPRTKGDRKKKSNSNSRSESFRNKNGVSFGNRNKDGASSEVSSSSDGKSATEHSVQSKQDEAKKGENPSVIVEVDRNVVKIGEADSVTDDPKSNDTAEKGKEAELEAEVPNLSENLTKEWIESLIRKSLESSEVKKLVDQAKLIQKIGEVLETKKLKKIKKIIESDSESSSSSDKDEAKKTSTKKKRRVIVSDSSEDEFLAERLGVLDTDANNEGIEAVSGEKVEATASNTAEDPKKDDGLSKNLDENRDVRPNDDNKTIKDSHLRKKNEKKSQLENSNEESNDKGKKRTENKRDKTDGASPEKQPKDKAELSSGKNEDQTECTSNIFDNQSDEVSLDKPKMKTKRRNSLEMLQEDIREMFISEDVVTATGFRMCRLSKENQPKENQAMSSSSKRDETLSTTEKKAAEPSAETDDSAANKSKKSLRSRAAGEPSKSKSKGKKDAKRPLRNLRSKEFVPSSDSEEDQPLALRTEKKLPNVDSGTPNQEEDRSEESILRRSKRVCVLHKEPRVVMEKTDISKIEAAKRMFDSSSDESFSIDVAELAAAVDVSLRPEKNSDQESVDTVASSKRKNTAKRTSKISKKSSLLTDDKSDDGMYLTDEDSLISDISMSSNMTAGKRTSGSATRTCAREDLLSNILVGLVPEKNTSTDKGSEGDVDEDMNDPLAITEPNVKKPTKRKKKKFSWQLGIVTTKRRKKKKKAASATKSARANIEEGANVDANVSIDRNDNSAKIETSLENPMDHSANETKFESAQINFENIKPIIKTDYNTDIDDYKDLNDLTLSELNIGTEGEGNLNDSMLSIEENKPLLKVEKILEETVPVKAAENTSDAAAVVAPNDATTANEVAEKQPLDIVYDEQMEEVFRKTNVERLINYTYDGTNTRHARYKCLLCFYSGKNIVHHYKMVHPKQEVLISRLKMAKVLAAMAGSREPTEAEIASEYKFRCRFCCYATKGSPEVALAAFYEHCTTHTGEYRFRCNRCSYQAVAKTSIKTHYYKICRTSTISINNIVNEDEIPKENTVYGYLCRECNYVQLKRPHVEAHIAFWHRDKTNIEILKIDMSVLYDIIRTDSNKKSTGAASASANDSFFFEELKPQISELENAVRKESDDNDTGNDSILPKVKIKEEIQIKEEATDLDKSRESQGEPEGPVSTGNLSVFVCPPELENKDDEIQRERQKKMQEIADNIGISKNQSKSDLSIIDKLQNKMRTDVVVSSASEYNASADIPEAQENCSLPLVSSIANSSLLENNTIVLEKDPPSQSNSQETFLSFKEELLIADTSEVAKEADDRADTKIRDPLACDESDGEINEHECSTPIFADSDSSSEQSDTETTDVNKILKETSSMNASSSRDPMATIIQRLAAQLQNAASKPLETLEPTAESLNIDLETDIKVEPNNLLFPKCPNMVHIRNAQCLTKQREDGIPQEESYHGANQSTNFLRFRRLSGDKLSLGQDDQSDPQIFNTDETQSSTAIDVPQTDAEDEECSFLRIENVVSLAADSETNKTAVENSIVNDIRKAVEISPPKNKGISIIKKPNHPLILKKINVITPMSGVSNVQSIKPIGTPEHVTLIPVKDLPMSASKKPVTTTHLVTNFMPTMSATISPTTMPVTVSSASPSNVNYKVVKMLCTNPARTPSVLNAKSKDFTTIPSAVIKLKSVVAYTSMLTHEKLACFYKCMARDCDFASDSLSMYSKHYKIHEDESDKLNKIPPYDYQKCAYCCTSMRNWSHMETHLWDRHSTCRYQCPYCFYRAAAKSYVQQHQATCHVGKKFAIIIGKVLKQVQEEENVNRKEYVKPFTCTYEGCGKIFFVLKTFMMHLNTKHPASHMYSCHVCTTIFTSIEALISHYKRHGFFKFQCLYCIFGSENLPEMHHHLSLAHCHLRPQAVERSLPSMPTLQKPVIEQLILHTFDDLNIDETTLFNVDETAKSTQDMRREQTLPAAAPNADTASNKEQLKSSNNSLPNILIKHSKDTSPASTMENTTNNIIEKQPSETKISQLLEQQKEKTKSHVRKQTFLKSELLSCTDDSCTRDSLGSLSEVNCDDEFVNTNLLDNPEFFKNIIDRTGNRTTVKSEISDKGDKAEDSDIEILDIESDKGNGEDDADRTAEFSEQNAEVEKQFVSCGITKDKSVPEETAADGTAQLEEPLTLNDIKNTGYSECDLYKCGYLDCSYSALNASTLRAHINECNLLEGPKKLFCAHCKKPFVKTGFLLEHLVKAHGLKRFGCSLCEMRYAVAYQATAHMKMKHKCNNTKLVPADPTNPSADGLFIVQAVAFGLVDRKNKKRKGGKSELEENNKLSFGPNEIEQLPRQAIYNREMQCAICPYTTKVRTNIVRHLQLHAKDETVPETGPVNPVPCLDKKEKMFDKMVNLASSSHQNGRMGAKSKEPVKESEENDGIPKFVPEHKRYVCSVTECNYLTVDEAMLRYHLKALHSEEPYFRCPHCPAPLQGQESQNIAIDKMGVHLKMHDTRLYKCSHCNHHHYHRHVVERHLADKHPEKRPFVKVVRELESTENVQQPVQEETEEEVPDPDGNHWKCNLCEYKCVYKADIAGHADTVHGESCQYKCTLCMFKTNGKILLEQHVNGKHANDSNADYTAMYRRIKGVNKRSTEVAEQGAQDEPFDTTPLWRRSMPRIRHIRGILLEEEGEGGQEGKETETPATTNEAAKVSMKRKGESMESSTKPAKIKSTGKSMSLDENNKQSKEKSKRSFSCEKLSEKAGDTAEKQVAKESAHSKANKKSTEHSKAIELSDVNDSDVGRFGPYGKPDGNMYVCTLCNQFKTKYKHDMRDHLYRELNYARWHCKACGYLSVNRNALMQHFGKRHSGEPADHEPLSPDNAIEEWVMTLLNKQTEIIKATNKKMTLASKNANTSASSNASSTSSSIKSQPDKKTVNLSSAISNLQSDVLQDTNRSIDSDDGDSRDDLVIDIKDDESFEKSENEDKGDKWLNISETSEENLEDLKISCKHCKTKCANIRGLKMHVQVAHLKRFNYLCFYCAVTGDSEALMRQHVRMQHPDEPEKIIHNPRALGKPKLTNEFWEKEYGLDYSNLNLPIKSKKRKLEEGSDASNSQRLYVREKCNICGFVAMNYTGLKAHMRTHSGPKHNLKCSYCTYSCSLKPELLEHWEVNHSSLPFKYQERSSTAGSSSSETEKSSKKQDIDTTSEVEEENVHKQTSIVMYKCYYCDNRSASLESVKRHWTHEHKESEGPEKSFNAKINLPFRYREIYFPISKSPTKESANKSAESPRKDLAKQSESTSSAVQRYGWVCQWCQEFCETDSDRMTHQNMFHSHLSQNFTWEEERQQKKEEEEQKVDQSKNTFIAALRLSARGTEKHTDFVTETVPSFDSVVENSTTSQAKQSDIKIKSVSSKSGISSAASRSKGSNQPVARKSTTKSTVLHARPGPRVFKAVARKSTNPLPRYPSGLFMPRSVKAESPIEETKSSEPYSHYGIPSSPIDLNKLTTYMVVGGHCMKVTCQTLNVLIDIHPKVLLKDIVKEKPP